MVFGQKTDKNGDYIRKYLPQLRKFPSQYIYEPWKVGGGGGAAPQEAGSAASRAH